MVGNKIADKTAKVLRTSPQNSSCTDEREAENT